MNRVLAAGLAGSVITALCCFTPVLVMVLSLLGLGAVTGYLDYVLLPGLVAFLGLTLYGLSQQKRTGGETCCPVRDPHTNPGNNLFVEKHHDDKDV
jgi:mercuric ion transport protein